MTDRMKPMVLAFQAAVGMTVVVAMTMAVVGAMCAVCVMIAHGNTPIR